MGTKMQVNLETFRGPLDLLLFLVKRHEVDIFDIPISQITEQFLQYVRALEEIDVEAAGEFLVMAATLMEIKSRMLLPRDEVDSAPEEDPRFELVKQLEEYRRFKDAAALLESRAEEQVGRLPRMVPEEHAAPGGPPPLRPLELWDLVSAFGRMMREAESLQSTPIIVDDTPQHVHIAQVAMRLQRDGRCTLRDLFTPPYSRSRLVGLFLALLEMMRRQRIRLEQSEMFGDILVALNDDYDPAADEPSPESDSDQATPSE
jgi:segregation and condensation protein A